MSLPVRLLGPLEVATSRISSSLYVCSTCRRQCLHQSLRMVNHNSLSRRPISSTSSYNSDNNGDLSVTEKLRRKIWGTDKPPGLNDPYGSESQLNIGNSETEVYEEDTVHESEMEGEQGAHVATNEEIELANYKRAATWDGLKLVGVEKWWERLPKAEDCFYPFMAIEKTSSRDRFHQLLHQTMVELLVLEDMNKPLTDVCNIIGHEDYIRSIISQVEVRPSNDFLTGTLTFPSEETKKVVYDLFSKLYQELEDNTGEEVEKITYKAEESAQLGEIRARKTDETQLEEDGESHLDPETTVHPPKNLDFLTMSLADPEFKFAYLKRASQLTGYRIPDPEIAQITKPVQLVNFLITVSNPKPKKLAEQLLIDKRLTSLPNVKIMGRRYTPIDKEKEIGRWKVIEKELIRRGLPVTGRLKT
ncbi:hypothetical protein GX48_03092 [Paracoccidioides brasiliensis]|nr:hypothetical protein GX48_03092 [Paracoccidioides brasiliensis]